MLQLTDIEKVTYNEKKKVLADFIDTFASYFHIYDDIILKFTIKELLSEDFRENVFPKLTSWVGRKLCSCSFEKTKQYKRYNPGSSYK